MDGDLEADAKRGEGLCARKQALTHAEKQQEASSSVLFSRALAAEQSHGPFGDTENEYPHGANDVWRELEISPASHV